MRHKLRIRLLVREICEQRNITKVQLSRQAEIQYDTVRGIWNNAYRTIDVVTLVRIARALHVQVTDLFVVENAE